MSTLPPIPAGGLAILSDGHGEDIENLGLYRACRDVDPAAARDSFLAERPAGAPVDFDGRAFLDWLVERGDLERVACQEWWLGAGGDPSGMATFPAGIAA